MYRCLRVAIVAAKCLLLFLVISKSASAATLTEINEFGDNPTQMAMHLYVPDDIGNNVPVVLALHPCTVTGPGFYSGTRFNTLADIYGFIVIYPTKPVNRSCFDVSTEAALKGMGSDPVGLMAMLDYVRGHYNIDDTRVFSTGVSSGAMMTQVLLALYPEVFSAGAAFAGVPYTCLSGNVPGGWNSTCADGDIDLTPQQWGDLVREVNPGYAGISPRMQLWHGTADINVVYANFRESIEQWTDVHGLSQTPSSTETLGVNTRTRYGGSVAMPLVEGNSLEGADHQFFYKDPSDNMFYATEAIRFFGLDSATMEEGSSSAQQSSLTSANESSSDQSSSILSVSTTTRSSLASEQASSTLASTSVASSTASSATASPSKASGGGGAVSLMVLLLGILCLANRRG